MAEPAELLQEYAVAAWAPAEWGTEGCLLGWAGQVLAGEWMVVVDAEKKATRSEELGRG